MSEETAAVTPPVDQVERLVSAAIAAERQRITLALLGCIACGRIHEQHAVTEPAVTGFGTFSYLSWGDPDDGHTYQPRVNGWPYERHLIIRVLGGGDE
jgi:hypothetical protein